MAKRKWLWILVGGVGLAALGAVALWSACPSCVGGAAATPRAGAAAPETGTAVGQRLPEVAVRSLEGEPVPLAELVTGPTVLYFSAVWCTSCRAEVGKLVELKNRYGERLNVVYVDVTPQTDTPQAVRAFAREFGWPQFAWTLDDPQVPAAVPLKVYALGTAYLVDPRGVIAFRGVNSVDTGAFRQALASLLE